MSAPYSKAIEGVTNLLDQFIDDGDLRAKLDFEVQKLKFELDKLLLTTTTTPRTDSFVKILLAFRDIILPMLRPLGAAAMTSFAAYCSLEGIELDSGLQAILYGAFPAWGASRHVNKQNEQKTKQYQSKHNEDDDF
jgi:hypothetical protein